MKSFVLIAGLLGLVLSTAFFGSLNIDRTHQGRFAVETPNWKSHASSVKLRRTDGQAFFAKGILEVPVEIQDVRNVYEAMSAMDSLRLTATGGDQEVETTVIPGYQAYSSSNELLQNLPALIQIQIPRGTSSLTLSVNKNGRTENVAAFSVDIEPRMFDSPGPRVSSLAAPSSLLKFLLVGFLFSILACWRLRDSAGLNLYVMCKAVFLAAHIVSPWRKPGDALAAWLLLDLVFAAVPPRIWASHWLAIGTGGAPSAPTRIQRALSLASVTAGAGFFVWVLLSGTTFKWSIFEERDFLSAWDVFQKGTIPALGPQLLAGGQTPGGGLYLMLAPIVGLFHDPSALAVFNKLLFFSTLILIGGVARALFGWVPAAFAVLVFATSSAIISSSYWPIHPYMSFFFYLFTMALGALAAKKGRPIPWAVFGIMIAVLCQLHFSYLLILIPALAFVAWQAAGRRTQAFGAFALGMAAIYLPYLLYELKTGGHNLGMIAAKPRFHPIFSPQVPYRPDTAHIGMWMWLDSVNAMWNPVQRTVLQFFLWLGVGGTAAFLMAVKQKSAARAYLGLIFLVFSFSFIFLSLFGMGYSYRHFMTVGVLIPTFAAVGVWFVLKIGGPRLNWLSAPMLMLAIAFLVTFFNRPVPDFVRGNGEWAVDYKERLKVARYMIEDLGLQPDQYRKHVVWWWFGWSVSPEIYDMYHQRYARADVRWPDEKMIFVISRELVQSSDLIFKNYQLTKIQEFPSVLVYSARLEGRPLPTSNSRNPTRLNGIESSIEQARAQDGLTEVAGAGANFLLALESGRIRAQLHAEAEGRRVTWNLESPSMSGYYQELKTVWNPRLEFTHKTKGEKITVALGPDPVLGSFLSKTPLDGVVTLPAEVKDFDVRLALDGWFDQSKMSQPTLKPLSWAVSL